MEFVGMLLGVTLIILTIIFFICFAMALGLGECVKDLWKLFLSAKPKTGIDKEIEEEEKEIAELEKHKEKMNKLAELKKRKTELFNDVHEVHEEELGEYWTCPQCRREFKGLEGLNNHRAWEHRP